MAEQEAQNEKDIALIKQDLIYIKKDLSEIKSDLRTMIEHYITREEVESRFKRVEKEIDTRIKGSHEHTDRTGEELKAEIEKVKVTLNNKLNKEDFEPVKKLAMVVITAVVLALLAVIGLK